LINAGVYLAQDPEFYTLKEVATLLRVSMTTIYGYTRKRSRKDRLPTQRFGRNCIRVPRNEFLKWAGLDKGAL